MFWLSCEFLYENNGRVINSLNHTELKYQIRHAKTTSVCHPRLSPSQLSDKTSILRHSSWWFFRENNTMWLNCQRTIYHQAWWGDSLKKKKKRCERSFTRRLWLPLSLVVESIQFTTRHEDTQLLEALHGLWTSNITERHGWWNSDFQTVLPKERVLNEQG